MFQICAPLFLLAPLLMAELPAPRFQEQGSGDATQDEPAKKKGPLERWRESKRAKRALNPELLRADGSVVHPGEIPAQASAASRASWEALIDSMRGPRRIESFFLVFNLRQRSQENSQSNDVKVSFKYLAPRFVRAHLESGRELLRGPKGDYLIDRTEVIQLVGREGIEDIKQLDQMSSIATSFVGLTDPLSLRLMDLELIKGPDIALPSRIKPKEREGLTWIRITSPDFYLYTGASKRPGPQPLYRADLGVHGVHGESKAIRFAIIREAQPPRGVPPRTMFVRMTQHLVRDRRLVPQQIEIYELDGGAMPPRFKTIPTSRLNLKRKPGRLNARLGPDDFLPPKR